MNIINPASPNIAPVNATPTVQTTGVVSDGGSFKDTLRAKLLDSSNLKLTNHAAERVEQRNIDMSQENIERLSEGVKIAEEKGMHAPLILIDKSAFIVNLKNRALVTTVNGDELKNNAFTNIDGTVIV